MIARIFCRALGRMEANTAMNDRQERLAHLLRELPDQFRVAMEAEVEFREWYTAEFRPITDYLPRFADFVEASEPYAQAYREISAEFPGAIQRVNELLLPIQQEYFSE